MEYYGMAYLIIMGAKGGGEPMGCFAPPLCTLEKLKWDNVPF